MAGAGRWFSGAAAILALLVGEAAAQTFEESTYREIELLGALNTRLEGQKVYVAEFHDEVVGAACEPLSTVLREAMDGVLLRWKGQAGLKFERVEQESQATHLIRGRWRTREGSKVEVAIGIGRVGSAQSVVTGRRPVVFDVATLPDRAPECLQAYEEFDKPGKVRDQAMLRLAPRANAAVARRLKAGEDVWVAMRAGTWLVIQLAEGTGGQHNQAFGFVKEDSIEVTGATQPAKSPTDDAARKSGEVFRDTLANGASCDAYCPELVVLPLGSYIMGAPPGEGDADEQPQHRVTIAKPFAAGKYEVTFAEWDECVIQGGCRSYQPPDQGWGRGRRPVINVSWEDAQAYVTWLKVKTGQDYRLLTEAEWEYAARGIMNGTAGPRYSWGDVIGRNRANCDGCGSQWDKKQTAPVGSFAPNKFGLYDMHGNVWEWVEDLYFDSYLGAPSDGSARASGQSSWRVLRGGPWGNIPRYLRAAERTGNKSDIQLMSVGFRVARDLDR